MGKAGENGTEPFGGKTQTVPEDHAAKVHEGRGKARDGGNLEHGCGEQR